MSDKSIILLPVDEAKHCVPEAGAEVAKWVSPSENSLGALVEDLSEYKTKIDVTSIPDIWAGPKAFETQLLDDVEAARIRWRAVLAIIGLRKVMRFNLQVKTISIPKVGDAVYKSKNTHPFLKVVARLMDKEFAANDGSGAVNIIYYDNKALAMVWPNSIIYPVPGAGNNHVNWWDGVKYQDPSQKRVSSLTADEEVAEDSENSITSEYLSEPQRRILVKWLEKLKEKVAKGTTSTIDSICDCLEKYIKALSDGLEEEDEEEELIYSEKDAAFLIEGYGSMLSQAYALPASEKDLERSNIRLDGRKKDKCVLVVDAAVATQWNKDASNIICFAGTDLSSALEIMKHPAKKRQFLEESKLANYHAELWTIDNFFTKKITYITGFAANANPFPNSLTEKDEYRDSFCFDFGKNNVQEFILPIRKEVLDFIAPEDLVKNLVIEREGSSSEVKVSLTIELSGCNDDGRKEKVVLTKVYKEHEIVKRTKTPNVQIWPNFKADCWKQYYVFTGTELEPDMTIEPAWSTPEVENLNFDIKAKEINVKLRRGAEFPSVFVCQVCEDEQIEPVGLICINEKNLEEPKTSTKDFCIGVDFGTTNSVVYYYITSDDDDNRRQMRFANRNFSVTRIKENDKNDLRRYFFPASEQPEEIIGATTSSIRTIFHDFNLADEKQIENKEQPLVMGNIYYLEDGQNISDDLVVIDELKGNIKWDDKLNTNENRMHSFVHQLCLQAMAEAVMGGARTIVWQYSWPSAYDSNKRKNYGTFWRDNLIEALNIVADISKQEAVYQKTESLSMADYFQNGVDEQVKGLANTNGLLTIDIGGGSTDIALWKGKNSRDKLNLLEQCSFKFAGTDILSDYLKTKYKKYNNLLTPLGDKNRDLEEKFNKLTELAKAAEQDRSQWKTFELELESILKYSEKELIQGMSVTMYTATQYQALNTVMRDIAFAIGGIFYYAGSIIGFLRKTDAECPIDRKLPDCFVGGNGSKLLDWAAKGDFSKSKELKNFLRMCIAYGMLDTMQLKKSDLNGFDTSVSIQQSEKPKHEVAYGLVSGQGDKISELDDTDENYKSANAVDDLDDIDDIDDIDDFDDGITGNVDAEADKHKSNVLPVVPGECYFIKGSAESDDLTRISVDNFTNAAKTIRIDNDAKRNRFRRYCRIFKSVVERHHLFNGKAVVFNKTYEKDDLKDIFAEVDNELQSRETKTGKSVVVEPIFIMELRRAIKKLSSY